jgi:hypothetical protein
MPVAARHSQILINHCRMMMMGSIEEAYGPLAGPTWENKENPQVYDRIQTTYIHPEPKRHILGLVGGNEVSLIKGNIVDLESDLRGINLPNTFCPWRQYQPPAAKATEIKRATYKGEVAIDVRAKHLPAYQMWAYPAVAAPLPMKNQVCKNPEKY